MQIHLLERGYKAYDFERGLSDWRSCCINAKNSCAAKFISHRSGQILELDHEIDLVYAQTRASDQAGAKTCCSSR